MDFIIGGSYQGKRTYIQENYQFDSVFEGADGKLEELDEADIILDMHLLIRRFLENGFSQEEITRKLSNIHAKVIAADEIGYGLVPVDKFERMYREAAGRQCCQIAKRAETVIRMVCGIPSVIKRSGISLLFIRHGYTKGNEEKRYVGITDESLSESGKEKLVMQLEKYKDIDPDIIFVSPMKRCLETAQILFPHKKYEVIDDFRECDFGQFEYKNYKELDGNEYYQRFIDSGGMTGFPDGELPEMFRARCQEAFLAVMKQIEDAREVRSIAFVVHGGTIMSILDGFSKPHKDYFAWKVSNGEGFFAKMHVDEKTITDITSIE